MDTEAFRGALKRLEEDAREDPPIAFMCAETLFWHCHRRLIADALSVDGISVIHLIGPKKQEEHPIHPDLRVDEQGRPVYDLHTTGVLLP